ncbi:hypothetical protein D3C80_1301130 [compost metagenome]
MNLMHEPVYFDDRCVNIVQAGCFLLDSPRNFLYSKNNSTADFPGSRDVKVAARHAVIQAAGISADILHVLVQCIVKA